MSAPGLALAAHASGRLVRRYKRFLADVELDGGGGRVTAHCPDPGRMDGLAVPGAWVRLSESDDRRRKLRHTLEMIRAGRTWVGVHPGRANAVVRAALEAAAIPELAGYRELRAEVAVGTETRLDFRLADHAQGAPPAWLEVKSATLAEGERARFPDSVTERGRRHCERLAGIAKAGERAVLLFLVQRSDCTSVEPADDVDPAYGEALRAAHAAGVELLALGAKVTAHRIRVTGALPVRL